MVENPMLPAAVTRRTGAVVQHPTFQGAVLALSDSGGFTRRMPWPLVPRRPAGTL